MPKNLTKNNHTALFRNIFSCFPFFKQAKAFDKRTSVLFYLVKLVKENDEGLLKFTEDIPTVPEVSGQMIDSLFGDLKQLSKELEEIQKTADVEADRLKDENGKVSMMFEEHYSIWRCYCSSLSHFLLLSSSFTILPTVHKLQQEKEFVGTPGTKNKRP